MDGFIAGTATTAGTVRKIKDCKPYSMGPRGELALNGIFNVR